MNEAFTKPDLQIIQTPERPDSAIDPEAYLEYRATVLENLLGDDLEHMQDTGILNMFEFDMAEGRDALLHILIGDTPLGVDGLTVLPGGFHHEPSAQDRYTYVDREHLNETINAKKRKAYEERPFEPYRARVVVNGLRKLNVITDPDTNDQRVVPLGSNMFPKEYDAVTVLKTIAYAYEHQVEETKKALDGKVIVEGIAPLVSNEEKLRVKFVLDEQTGKIRTALPVVSKAWLIPKMTENERKEMLGL